MFLFETPLVLLALTLLIGLHVGILFMPDMIAKIMNYVNIGLHIAILPLMLTYRYTIEEGVLVYMISVFSYSLASYIKYTRSKKTELSSSERDPIGGEDKA